MQYDGTLIIVSHDREFLAGLTETTIEFRDKKLYEHLGDVNYFLERRELDNMRDVELSTKVAAASSNGASKNGDDKERKKAERNVQTAEKRIADLEKQVANFEKDMANPSFYNRSDAQKVLDKYKSVQKELATEMEKWELALVELEG